MKPVKASYEIIVNVGSKMKDKRKILFEIT